MRLIDERGRLFGLINLFDLLALTALVILIGAVGMRIVAKSNEKQAKAQTKTWIATVKCSSVPDSFMESIMMDNRLYYETDGFVNARVVEIKEEEAQVMSVAPVDGTAVVYDPNLKDVYVQIEIQDDPSDEGVKVGRYAVCVGGSFTLKTPYAYSTNGLVLDLREKE